MKIMMMRPIMPKYIKKIQINDKMKVDRRFFLMQYIKVRQS